MGLESLEDGYHPWGLDRKQVNHILLQVPYYNLALLVLSMVRFRILVVNVLILFGALSGGNRAGDVHAHAILLGLLLVI